MQIINHIKLDRGGIFQNTISVEGRTNEVCQDTFYRNFAHYKEQLEAGGEARSMYVNH